ncbi:MAG: tetratricopeptide repeat protein [Thalassobaculum sp.]|uniref:tetratricopeptide repeat protein n=1 Tax=Thalassobaculum sp. TaxID=2022740 RepID=UPI0032EE3F87
MTTPNALLARAVAAHRNGRIGEAATEYRNILAIDPGHARARHLLGFALLQLGSPDEAEPMLTEALRRWPKAPDAWAHLGLALSRLGRAADARTALRRSLLLAPALLDGAEGLLDVAFESNDGSTEKLADRLVVLAPRRPAGWHRRGLSRIRRAPDLPAVAEAERILRRAVLLVPDDVPALTDLADTLRMLRLPQTAWRVGIRALRASPGSSAARVVLAAALVDLDRAEAAEKTAMAAATLSPAATGGYGNLAQCLYGEGRFDGAVAMGRRACTLAPRDPQLLANLATYHLARGDLERGWPLFRHRPARRLLARSPGLPAAAWNGGPAPRLLVLAEQGLGDELLFASCWRDLAAMVRDGALGSAAVEIDPRLRPLATRSFPRIDWLDRPGSRERRYHQVEATHWVAAGDLPTLLRRRIADFPPTAGYLVPDPARVAGFREWLAVEAPDRYCVGLCWRSGLQTADRGRYYPPLEDCRPLLDVPRIRLVALQYDDFTAEIAAAWPADRPSLLIPPGLDRRDDLDGVAALIAALDATVTADTAVLALAGAVGASTLSFGRRATWVALGQTSPPWHPSVVSAHRAPDETWMGLMRRIAGNLPVRPRGAANGRPV